jgi:hypothetical protein
MVRRFIKYRRIFLLLMLVLPLLAMLVLTTPALAAPVVIISPGSGATGTNIIIQGNNFNSYKGDYISITFDAFEIPTSPLEVPDSGSFITEFTIPEMTIFGRHWITVYSSGGTVSMLARNFFIVEETLITLDVTEGPVGTEVNISGQGFYSNRTVDIYYTNISADKLGNTTTSSTGLFSFNFTVPNSIGGYHTVTAINDKGNLAEAQFKITSEVFTNLAAAGPGELLAMIGTGFGYRSQVEIDIGSHPITTVKTNDTGDFEVVFNIPGINPGVYDIQAEDEYNNQAKIKFTVTANVGLSLTSGAVGSTVTASGSGFTAKTLISVLYDDVTIATTTADNLGRFTISFSIPASDGGSHQIIISDGSFTRQFTFIVESEAPAAPELKLPVKNTETKSMTYFDWEDANDPSQPVTYQLQVASDQNFSTILRDKPDLPKSEYNLTLDEALPAITTGLPYYWRVRARDAAGNESEWSESSSFYIYPPPAPALLQPDLDTTVAIPIFFNWQDISTLNSPVTYHLQISTDLGFATLALEEIGLDDSEYYLSDPEYLPETGENAPYYWRVKTIDSVHNESGWSETRSFFIQNGFSFPSWAIYTLIGIGAILVGYLAYWVGRRTTFRPSE